MTFTFRAPPLNLGMFDLGGVLYHANYFQVYEQAREACLLNFGVKYSDIAASQMHFALTASSQKFLAPIKYGDQLRIELTCTRLRKTGFELSYKVFTDRLVNEATTSHACVSSKDGKLGVVKLPEEVVAALTGVIPSKK